MFWLSILIFRLTKSVGVFSNNLRCPILNQDLSQSDLENDGSKGIDSVIMDQFPLVRVWERERQKEREGRRERGDISKDMESHFL